MSRIIALLVFIHMGTTVFGHQIPIKSLPVSHFQVKSEQADENVAQNKCHVFGHVKDPSSGLALANVIVSTLDRKKETRTDSLGYYELILDATDTSLFAFKSQFAELVIWSYNFKGGHRIELDFYLTEDWGMTEMDKPVIYLYSEVDMDVSLDLNVEGELTFSYPVYNDGWNVHVNQEGIQANGRNYPYLFWEGQKEGMVFPEELGVLAGDFIKTDTIYSYLEHKLSSLGLNATEQTDFITYWAPRMTQKSYAFVSFLVDEAYEQSIAQLHVKPSPDSQRRVFMVYSPTNKSKMAVPHTTQSLNNFERSGFTLLEWGGSELRTNLFDYDTVDY